MTSKPSKIVSETINTGALNVREIVAVRINAEDGSEAWFHATHRKDGGLNTKSITLPAGEYEIVRESALFALTDVPEWLDGAHTCGHDHREHGQAGSWAFARLNKPGSPHDCQVCYGTPKWAHHCHTVSPRDGMTCGERKDGWAATAKAKADAAKADAERAAKEASEAAATPVEAPVEAPAPRRSRSRKVSA